jgi:hypothetical protein
VTEEECKFRRRHLVITPNTPLAIDPTCNPRRTEAADSVTRLLQPIGGQNDAVSVIWIHRSIRKALGFSLSAFISSFIQRGIEPVG